VADKPISADYAKMLANEEARHEAEKKALIEEFSKVIKEEWSAEDIKEKLTELMPNAYASLQHLILNAESESVRAGLIKYIFNIALQDLAPKDADITPDQEFKKLLGDLATKPKAE
jgi:hypothetical protein